MVRTHVRERGERRPQHDRHRRGFVRLDQCHRLEEFVERAESAGQADRADGVFEEQHLAHKEIVEVDRDILEAVGDLL